MRIGGGVPDIDVDAIQNAAEPVRAFAKQAIQPATEFRTLDFPCIRGADRGYAVGKNQPPLDKAQLIIKLQRTMRPQAGGQPQLYEGRMGKNALVGQIVNREHSRRPLRFVIQQCGNQSGLPVVAMHDIRLPIQTKPVHGDFNRDMTQQREPLGIVGPGLAIGTQVGIAIATKVIGLHQSVNLDIRTRQDAMPQSRAHMTAWQLQGVQYPDIQGLRIAGNQNANIMPQLLECNRQTTGNVSQTSGLDQRISLAGNKKDLFHSALDAGLRGATGTSASIFVG